MDILNIIKQGENKTTEFKVELPTGKSIPKAVVAFSNTGGGKIIIGVADNGDIIGLKPDVDLMKMQDRIASIIFDNCSPNIIPDIYIENVEGKTILIVEVYRGNILPYYLKQDGKNDGVYIRIGATNRKADQESILELERQRMNLGYDQVTDKSFRLIDLDTTEIKEQFTRVDKKLNKLSLKNLRLAIEENGEVYPTNGLLILLGELEHVRIKCARFRGNSMDVFFNSKEFDGNLFNQLENAQIFIQNHIKLESEIKALQRKDTYEIPIEAIRESLVNAVVHRDYSNEGRDIKVSVFDNMVKIVSPGSFPSTITQSELLEGRSEIRNKVLARTFKELGYIEQWGSGIQRIMSSCINRGLRKPEIIEKADTVEVILYREHLKDLDSDVNQLSIGEQEKTILSYLEDNNNQITTKAVSDILKVRERRSREILGQMVERDILEGVGATSNRHYRKK